jgi:acetylornithine deacetylase
VPNWPVSKLCRPIFIALSYDEEIGCLGAPRLISDLRAHLPKPALAVIGEPTGMRAVTAHKGVFVFRTEFRGRAVHSSDPEAGLSAVQYAVRFMQLLFDVAVELREVTTAVHGLDPPFTTLNVGLVSGGTALNIVPPVATITWEFRPIPEADIAGIRGRIDFAIGQLRSEMQRRCPEADIRIQQLARVLPLRAVADNAAVSAVRRLGVADAPTPAVPFGTEAGLFQAAEIPAVVCGPGSIAQAHRPDEWLAIDQLGEAASFVANLGNAAKTAE